MIRYMINLKRIDIGGALIKMTHKIKGSTTVLKPKPKPKPKPVSKNGVIPVNLCVGWTETNIEYIYLAKTMV